MNIKSSLILTVLSMLFSLSVTVRASELAGSGEVLGMLQKIQGEWRTICKPVQGGSTFSIAKLSVTFTHFSFVTTEYKTGRCVMVESSTENRYRFALRGVQELSGGKSAFAIDFKQEQSFGAEGTLYPSNLIYYEGGSLFLGSDIGKSKAERLTGLNLQQPFIR